MTSLDYQLWELIKTHKMPEDATGTPFIDQLMAENRISHETATVAIAEYQKFMYLCATRQARNVPSKAVDLVWHLHMQYSRDYWDVFCKKLGKPVHHNPGGQGPDHLEDYKATVAAYKDLFGAPPKGIWRENSRAGNVVGLVIMLGMMLVGGNYFYETGSYLFGALWMSILIYGFVVTLKGLTAQGEVTLIFECDDPFANDEAGDCGAGDCGGCGD